MNAMKITETEWNPDKKLIVTRLSGDVTETDIIAWEQSLQNALEQIDAGGTFKIFVNIYGFKATDLKAHKRYREIIPLTLASYGWKVGYVDLFEEAASMQFTNTRGIRCIGAAHAHQDATKIEAYEERFGRADERFFTEQQKAYDWILAL